MRDYSKISPRFWIGPTGKKLRAAGMEAQVVAMYLLTSPHANMLGLYYCPVMFIAHETGLGLEGAIKGLHSAIEAGFCEYDGASEMVWVIEMASYQVGEALKPTDLRVKGVQNEYANLPENPYLERFYEKYGAVFFMGTCRHEASPLQAPCKPLPSQEQEQEKEQEQEQDSYAATDRRVPPKKPDPEKSETELQAACKRTWEAYSIAYRQRYGADPVRNTKVNTQVKQFVQRIGHSESPPVAEFFVTHQNSFYVRKGHDWGSLLSDAEKIRTEWVTGKKITSAQAQQADRTASNLEAANEAIRRLEGATA